MKIVTCLTNKRQRINWNNKALILPTSIIVHNDKELETLSRVLESHNIQYFIDSRWKQRKKPHILFKTSENTWTKFTYKNRKFIEETLLNDEGESLYQENVKYVRQKWFA